MKAIERNKIAFELENKLRDMKQFSKIKVNTTSWDTLYYIKLHRKKFFFPNYTNFSNELQLKIFKLIETFFKKNKYDVCNFSYDNFDTVGHTININLKGVKR